MVSIFALALMCASGRSVAQTIPNGGFESWTGNTPDGWTVGNSGPVTPVTRSSDAHSGSAALQGNVASLGPVTLGASAIIRFPVNARPTSFNGWYKFTSVGGDSMTIAVVLSKQGTGIGATRFFTTTSSAGYTQINAPILWNSQDIPDTAYIAILVGGTTSGHAGTSATIDDLAFSAGSTGFVAASQANNAHLAQSYPNPFSNEATITYSLTEGSYVSLNVYSVIGEKVATLAQGYEPAGAHTAHLIANNLPSGFYYYELSAGAQRVVRPMQLLR